MNRNVTPTQKYFQHRMTSYKRGKTTMVPKKTEF